MPATVYQRVKGDVRPLKGQILVTDMEQGTKITRGGLIVPDDNGSDRGIRPRWCHVYKVGENVVDVEAGQWVLVEHGRWTYGITVERADGTELYLQRIEPESMLLVSDEKPF